MKHFFSVLILLGFLIPATAQTSGPVKTSGCVEGNCGEGTGKYLFENGDKYNGEWHGGMRTGYGRYDYKNGDWYIGDFRNDAIDGKGTLHLKTGEIISGVWQNYVLVKIEDAKYAARLNLTLPLMQIKKN